MIFMAKKKQLDCFLLKKYYLQGEKSGIKVGKEI